MRSQLFFLSACILACSCQQKTPPPSHQAPIAAAAMIPSLQVEADSTQEKKWTYIEREIDYLMQIWPGEYDNVEQLDYHKYAHPDAEVQPKRIHATIKKIDNSGFGENVLYVDEYTDDNPDQLTHQAIYHLTPDEENRTIAVLVYEFKMPSRAYIDGIKKQDLEELSPISPLLRNSWNITLEREGLHYAGKTEVDTAGEFLQILISENRYNISRNIYESGNIQHQLVKARCFVCMIDFPREDGGRPVNTVHYIPILDQGGKFEFDYRDGRHMVLGMRNTWSYGMQRETFVIFIQEGSQEGPTLIYSWGEPGADRIGFNPGWIRVQCDLDTPRNRQLQQDLRPDS